MMLVMFNTNNFQNSSGEKGEKGEKGVGWILSDSTNTVLLSKINPLGKFIKAMISNHHAKPNTI